MKDKIGDQKPSTLQTELSILKLETLEKNYKNAYASYIKNCKTYKQFVEGNPELTDLNKAIASNYSTIVSVLNFQIEQDIFCSKTHILYLKSHILFGDFFAKAAGHLDEALHHYINAFNNLRGPTRQNSSP